jgi:hypothetical protein
MGRRAGAEVDVAVIHDLFTGGRRMGLGDSVRRSGALHNWGKSRAERGEMKGAKHSGERWQAGVQNGGGREAEQWEQGGWEVADWVGPGRQGMGGDRVGNAEGQGGGYGQGQGGWG